MDEIKVEGVFSLNIKRGCKFFTNQDINDNDSIDIVVDEFMAHIQQEINKVLSGCDMKVEVKMYTH